MSVNKRAFTVTGLFFWLALCSVYCGSNASLRTMYVEELCYGTFSTTLSLRFQTSAILASVPNEPLDCELTLQTVRDSSIVIAFSRYSLAPSDSLVFRDRHNFQLSLSGGGNFLDERKSIIFEGPLRIRFITNDTYGPNRLKFQITYTQVHDGPCELDEYKCRNNKCIPSNLACDKHNHCGDIDDQGNCSPKNERTYQEDRVVVTTYRNPWIISIVVCGVILAIVVISFAAVGIQRKIQKKKISKRSQNLPTFSGNTHDQGVAPPTIAAINDVHHAALPTVAATTDVQHVAPPSEFTHIRHSFKRGHQSVPSQHAAPPTGYAPKRFEVPSMYPQIPSAPEYDGVDNPEFKIDE